MRLQPDSNLSDLDSNRANANQSNADLWGPIWITFTAAVALIVSSNVVEMMNYLYLENAKIEWASDFSTVVSGITMFFVYELVMPLILWIITKIFQINSSLLEFICLYGYSYSIHIPIYILCTIFSTYDFVRWILVLLVWIWTGLFIAMNVGMFLFRNVPVNYKIYTLLIAIGVFLIHFGMGVFLKIFFFTFFSYKYT